MPHSNHTALSPFLKRLLLHSRLSTDERNAVLSLESQPFEVEARHDIVFPDQTVEFCCLIGNGLVGRFDQMRDGRRQITALHITGDMCDLHSVVTPTVSWGLTALSKTLIYHIAHKDLRVLATTYPNLAIAFWRDSTVDALILAKWVTNIGRKNARARVAHLMCEMGMRMERAGLAERHHYLLPINQEHIGDATGLTPVHVNRTLQALRTEGALVVQKNQIKIPDWDRLTSIAEFFPTFTLLDDLKQQVTPGDVRHTTNAGIINPIKF